VQARTDLVMAVRNLVEEGLEASWDGRDLARRLGLSPATLRRRLAGEGTSVRSILLHLRMSFARTLLSDGRSTVAELALRCGYESPAKFSRQFAAGPARSPRRCGRAPPGRREPSVLALPVTWPHGPGETVPITLAGER
jgi:AraC-like DNA-binding protein